MKIAMLTNNYRPFVGGVPVSVERQAQELTRLGHQVTVVAPMYGDDEEARSRVLEQDERSPERVVRYRTQKMKMPNGMVYPSFRPEEVFAIFERETFDCIHVHHPVFAGIWALSLGKKYDIPVIYTYHTRYEDYLHYIPFFREKEERRHIRNRFTDWVKGSVIPSYMKWFCSQCDLVVAPSAGMLQVIRRQGVSVPAAVMPTGLDASFYRSDDGRAEEIREQYAKGRKHLLVTVSRLEREKNYGFLLRGIAEIEKRLGDDFHVLIIGDGSQMGELKVRASILGIRDKVTFMGNVPNAQVKDYLNAADLFLFASRSETQGIVLAEALAAGCPVVAVHATGADDVVRNGVNGFLTAEDESVWAEKAAEALRPENLGRMREAARSDADNYRASRLAIYAEMLYNQCVLRKGENGYERSEDRGGHVAAAVRKVS